MLTQADWYARLVSWYPSWMVQEGGIFAAHLMALAKVLEAVGEDVTNEKARTYIGSATSNLLDTHGAERSVIRKNGELDAALRQRIRNFALSVSQEDLTGAVEDTMPAGSQVYFYDRQSYGQCLDVDDLFSDNEDFFMLSQEKLYNYFYVYIPPLNYESLATDTVIGAGTTGSYTRLLVPEGVTLTVNGTLEYINLKVQGTLVLGPDSLLKQITPEVFYTNVTEQIKAVKAFGVEFEIWSEAFAE